jgi:hypothetical protein
VPKLISILDFAYLLGFRLYDWQARVLLRYEAGERVAVAACNFSGKTNVVFTVEAARLKMSHVTSARWRRSINTTRAILL